MNLPYALPGIVFALSLILGWITPPIPGLRIYGLSDDLLRRLSRGASSPRAAAGFGRLAAGGPQHRRGGQGGRRRLWQTLLRPGAAHLPASSWGSGRAGRSFCRRSRSHAGAAGRLRHGAAALASVSAWSRRRVHHAERRGWTGARSRCRSPFAGLLGPPRWARRVVRPERGEARGVWSAVGRSVRGPACAAAARPVRGAGRLRGEWPGHGGGGGKLIWAAWGVSRHLDG